MTVNHRCPKCLMIPNSGEFGPCNCDQEPDWRSMCEEMAKAIKANFDAEDEYEDYNSLEMLREALAKFHKMKMPEPSDEDKR